MTLLRKLFALSLLASAIAVAQGQEAAPTLKVGDPAPPLKIREWVKGTPVTTLGHGSVNVVEFWATWCPPCRESIPHLTELAHKYKRKATFTGVSVFETHGEEPRDESFLPKVKDFVKNMGEKMDYNVAADGKAGTMGKTWMDAAGQETIPTAFVVDQLGKIVWIGQPMNGLDEVVGKVIEGNYDPKAEAEKEAKKKAELEADGQALEAAVEAKKFDVAAVEASKLIEKHPEFTPQLSAAKFQFLMMSDEKAGYAFARELAAGKLKNNGELLDNIAWSILDEATPIKHRDYATAVFVAKQAAEAGKMKEPHSLDTYALALFKIGDAKGALTVQQTAMVLAAKPDTGVNEKQFADMKQRLAMFKAKAKT